MRILRYLLLALVGSVAAPAQIQVPQINLSGNIGCQGFPCVNTGTLVFTSDANHAMTVQETSAFDIKVTSSVSLTATRNLVAPTGRFPFTIENATTGGQSVQIIGSSGTGVTIPNGATVSVWNDGSNYVSTEALSFASTPTTCSSGYAPTGILPNGNATGCAAISSGSVSNFSAPSASWPAWLVPTVTNPTSAPSLAVAATSTGTGSVVLATSPSLTTPNIGAATGTSITVTGAATGNHFVSSVAMGAISSISGVGTGGTVSCVGCTEAGGYFVITTGTSPTSPITFFTATSRWLNCVASNIMGIAGTGGGSTSELWSFTSLSSFPASTAYEVSYVCN